jgi:DNA-directed RNA polymerase III subunit RPC1
MSVKGAQVDTAHGALDREIFDNGFPSDNGGCRDSDQGIPPHTGAVNAMLRNLSTSVPFDASVYGSYTFVHESWEPCPTAVNAWQRLCEVWRARQELQQIERQLEQVRRRASSLLPMQKTSSETNQDAMTTNVYRTTYAQIHRLLLEREQARRALSARPVTLRDDTQVLSRSLEAIQFRIPSVDDIRRASVIEMNRKQLYTPEHDIVPHGALDKHLGVSDKNERCATCGLSLADCAGHFGHIELVLPVFHVGYLSFLLQVLQCICKRCSGLLADAQFVEHLRHQQREHRARNTPGYLQSLLKRHLEWAKRSSICRHCGAPNGLVRKVSSPREWLATASAAATSSSTTCTQRDGSGGIATRAASGLRSNSSMSHTGAPRLVHELMPRAGWSQRQYLQLELYLAHWYERASFAAGRNLRRCPADQVIAQKAPTAQASSIAGVLMHTADGDKDDLDSDHNEFNALPSALGKPAASGASLSAAVAARRMMHRSRKAHFAFELTPLHVLELLRNIAPADLEALGMDPDTTRPEDMLLRCVAVPPVCIRPSVCNDPSQGSTEDDLTIMLADIAGANALVMEQLVKGSDLGKLLDAWDHLQLAVARYIHADYPGLPASLYYKAQIGLCQRLKGKQGRFRGNLSGKRVDFSARTVISPDPNLSIDQVGVPLRIAKILTYPERVTPWNIDQLRKSVLRGPDRHPGANYVLFPDGSKRFLRFGDREDIARSLCVGCVVERHLRDGDLVLFNRQPSLHRLSIMAHSVKVIAGRTFRFNECVCAPYNADFDGDEMNLHVPQTEEARAEARALLAVPQNLLSPRNGEPLIACTQDFITALYLLTHKDVFYGRWAAVQCLSFGLEPEASAAILGRLPEPAILHPLPLWTGKQLFSALVQADPALSDEAVRVLICFDATEKAYTHEGIWCRADAYVCVRSAELISGQVAKRTLGSQSKQSLLYVLQREAGPLLAVRCMNRLARFASRWLSEYGFSFGIDDVRPSPALEHAKAVRIRDAYTQVQDAIERYRAGVMRPRPGYTDEETLEWHIHRLLSDLREHAGQVCLQEMAPHNTAMIMAMSGAKGSTINISQMVACVGQQTVNGTRVRAGFHQRTLPHFMRGDKSPEAGGFVANSFYSGMNAIEFFFHSMAGREGLVDTAVKTAETGYMQRRFMKALEDLRVAYDDTVRTSDASLVQLRFGGDGLDPLEMEASDGQAIDWERLWTTVQWLDAHSDPLVERALGGRFLADSVPSAVAVAMPDTGSAQALPGASHRYQQQQQQRVQQQRRSWTLASPRMQPEPERMVDDLQRPLLEALEAADPSTAAFEQQQQQVPLSWPGRVRQGVLALATRHSPLTPRQWQLLMTLTERKLRRALIEPGTAVGAIAAQSIGEPSTQMTLKTFHFAGVASMNITQGVPRIKELVNATRRIATPLVTAYLETTAPGQQEPRALAYNLQRRLECRRLKQVIRYGEVRWNASGVYLDYVLDERFVAEYGLRAIDAKASATLEASGAKALPNMTGISQVESLCRRLRAQLPWPALSEEEDTCNDPRRDESTGNVRVVYANGSSDDDDDVVHLQFWPPSALARSRPTRRRMGSASAAAAVAAATTETNVADWEPALAQLQRLVPELVVSGLASIARVVWSQALSPASDSAGKSGEAAAAAAAASAATESIQLLAETEDMRSVMNTQGIDASSVYCNHVLVVEQVLGIEAARSTIVKEVLETMAAHGVTLDARHVDLLSDMMTQSGQVLGITRFGISKMRQSTLMLASFEKTVDHLFEAAVRSRSDRIRGVSERVIMGKPVPLGTGMVSVGYVECPERVALAPQRDATCSGSEEAVSSSLEGTSRSRSRPEAIQSADDEAPRDVDRPATERGVDRITNGTTTAAAAARGGGEADETFAAMPFPNQKRLAWHLLRPPEAATWSRNCNRREKATIVHEQ